MPSPSKAALFSGLAITACMFVGGAYAASYMADPITDAQRDFDYGNYIPSLAPGGNDAMPTLQDAPNIPTPQVKTAQGESNIDAVKSAEVSPTKETPQAPKGLTVTLNGVRNANGKVYLFVFDNEAAYQAYDYTQAVGYKEVKASPVAQTLRFPSLTFGPYVVGAFHDENGDQDFNMDANGYPLEGYATSNATSKYDDLNFEQAAIWPGKTTLTLYYLQ